MLNAEKAENTENVAKIEELNSKLAEMELAKSVVSIENARLNSELGSLKSKLGQLKTDSEVKEQNSSQSVNDNVQIDELVREIEYCIGQLKNNA